MHGNRKMDGGCDCDECNFDKPRLIQYMLSDGDSGVQRFIHCQNIKCAREVATDWAKDGDYGQIESTIWVDIYISCEEDGDDRECFTVAINPDEPRCSEDEHDWQSPIDLVGGIKENPGVWGNAGGVIIVEACVHCGCKKTTDTWAQRMDTGEQGLTSIQYEENAFALEAEDSHAHY